MLGSEIAGDLVEKERVERWFAGCLHASGYATLRVIQSARQISHKGPQRSQRNDVILLSFVPVVLFV
jgi:hypothetical protein